MPQATEEIPSAKEEPVDDDIASGSHSDLGELTLQE